MSKRIIKNYDLMTTKAYRDKFFDEITETKLLDYFDGLVKDDNLMLLFDAGDWVPGGAWPGNYGRVTINDYSTRMVRRGHKKVILSENAYEYQDQEGMDDLVLYGLTTTAQNLQQELENKRTSLFSFPHRVHTGYQERLLVTINGEVAGGSNLTDEMLAEVMADLTPFERSKYEQSLYRLDVSLWPSVEQPVQVRIDGIDDGAEEALFADVASAHKALEDIAKWNSRNRRMNHGFQGTD